MTLEQIRAELPTHIMLTPNVHKWREGDEIYLECEDVWEPIDYPQVVGKHVLPGDHNARRPIPSHILDNQAWYLYFEQICDAEKTNYLHVLQAYETYRRVMILSKKAVSRLGGESVIAKNFNAGRLYDKWLREQMEGV